MSKSQVHRQKMLEQTKLRQAGVNHFPSSSDIKGLPGAQIYSATVKKERGDAAPSRAAGLAFHSAATEIYSYLFSKPRGF